MGSLGCTQTETTYKAYMYSSPTVTDLDGDGEQEIIVGTSVGYVYALNANLTSRVGFPIQVRNPASNNVTLNCL